MACSVRGAGRTENLRPASTARRAGLSCGRWFCLVVCGLTLAVPVLPHSDAPPVPPPPPLPGEDIARVEPLRWSWLHWWEANRARFLVPPNQGDADQDRQGVDTAAVRERVIRALRDGLSDRAAEAREACALALGVAGADETADAIIQALVAEPSPRVRQRMLTALPMLDRADHVPPWLLEHEYATGYLRATAILGFAWVRPLDADSLRAIERFVGDNAFIANAAAEALCRHPATLPLNDIKRRVVNATSPWIAARLLHALGSVGDASTDRVLLDIAAGGETLERLAAWRLLQDIAKEKDAAARRLKAGGQPQQLADARLRWRTAHRRLVRLAPEPVRPDGLDPVPNAVDLDGLGNRTGIVTGIERLYQSRLRTAAALAVADRNPEGAVRTLLGIFDDHDDFARLPQCFAAVALGEIGDPAALPMLTRLTLGRHAGRDRLDLVTNDDAPQRGFAAVALGLYARPALTEQGPVDRAGFERALEVLHQRLADRRETPEVRAACVMALGLSGRSINLPRLKELTTQLDARRDLVLIGHTILARAMLGDRGVAADAEALLTADPHRDETTDLLARRAAVLAVGLSGAREGVPLLVWAWDQPYFVNREVILALSLGGALGVADDLIDRLQKAESQYERAFMAEALGQLFADERPTPLDRSLVGRDFTLRDGLLEDHRTLANVFLYRYLIPQFEEPWY